MFLKALSGVCGTGIRAYEQLGYRAFGTPGKMAAGIAITLQNIGGEITLPTALTITARRNKFLWLFWSNAHSVSWFVAWDWYVSVCECLHCYSVNKSLCNSVCLYLLSTAMSSYLYIVKYEFPLVIQAFLKVDKPAGWVLNIWHKSLHSCYVVLSILYSFPYFIWEECM